MLREGLRLLVALGDHPDGVSQQARRPCSRCSPATTYSTSNALRVLRSTVSPASLRGLLRLPGRGQRPDPGSWISPSSTPPARRPPPAYCAPRLCAPRSSHAPLASREFRWPHGTPPHPTRGDVRRARPANEGVALVHGAVTGKINLLPVTCCL